MNSFDIFLLIFMAYFTIRGVFRGLIKELIIILALVLGYLLGFAFFEQGSVLLMKSINGLPQTGARILSFTIIFLVVNIALRILGAFLEKIIKFAFLQTFNRLGGGLFGLVKSLFFLSILLFIIRLLPFAPKIMQKVGAGESVIWPYVIYFSTYLYQIMVSIFPANSVQDTVKHLMSINAITVFPIFKPY